MVIANASQSSWKTDRVSMFNRTFEQCLSEIKWAASGGLIRVTLQALLQQKAGEVSAVAGVWFVVVHLGLYHVCMTM